MYILLIAGLFSLLLSLLGGWLIGRILKHPSLPRPETALPALIIIVSLLPIAILISDDLIDGVRGLQHIASHSDEYGAYALQMARRSTYAYGLIMSLLVASVAVAIYTVPDKTTYTSLAPYCPIPLMVVYTSCSSLYYDLYIQYDPTTREIAPFSDLAVGAPYIGLYFLSVLSTLFLFSLSSSVDTHRPQVSDTEVVLVLMGFALLGIALLLGARFVFGLL
jgi:hypothetical protein